MKQFITLFFLVVAISCSSQIDLGNKVNSVSFFVNPFIQKLGNLNNQYSSISNEFIDVDYIKTPAQEIGLEFHHNFKEKWGWGIGGSYHHANYRTYINLRNPDFSDQIVYTRYRRNEVHSISIRPYVSYLMFDWLKLNAHVSLYVPIKEVSNSSWKEEFGIVAISPPSFLYNTLIINNGFLGVPDIVPEISANLKIAHSFSFNVGFRFKFWELSQDFHYSIKVDGFAGQENMGTNETLHFSQENSQVMNFVMGLTYEIPFGQKKSVER